MTSECIAALIRQQLTILRNSALKAQFVREITRFLHRVAPIVSRLPPQLALVALGYVVTLSTLPPFAQLVISLACFVAATRLTYPARLSRLAQWLVLPALLWCSLLIPQTLHNVAYGLSATLSTPLQTYSSDAMFYNHYDAQLVLHGVNPYVGDHLADAIHSLHIAGYTPIARGRFSDPRHFPTGAAYGAPLAEYLAHPQHVPPEVDPRTVHSYPAGAFLVDVPFLWAGVPGISFPQVALYLLLCLALIGAAPPGSRIGVAVLLLAARLAAAQVTGWDFDIWPLALVIGAWLFADRRIASSILLGAACTIKQTIWFVVPLYLVWAWRTYGAREALRRAAIALATFVVINLPWIVTSPREWFASLWLPMSLPLFPGGDGLISLSLAGTLPLFPSWVYGALEMVALVGAVVWYWRAWSRYPFAGLILSYVPLLMAWRSADRYFFLLPVAAVAVLVLTLRHLVTRGEVAPSPATYVYRAISAARVYLVGSRSPSPAAKARCTIAKRPGRIIAGRATLAPRIRRNAGAGGRCILGT